MAGSFLVRVAITMLVVLLTGLAASRSRGIRRALEPQATLLSAHHALLGDVRVVNRVRAEDLSGSQSALAVVGNGVARNQHAGLENCSHAVLAFRIMAGGRTLGMRWRALLD